MNAYCLSLNRKLLTHYKALCKLHSSFQLNDASRVLKQYKITDEPDLYECDISIITKRKELVPLNAVFLDSRPSGVEYGTVLALHGSPGSHKDFKYVTPLLRKMGIRMIGVNFPGMGYTSYDQRLLNDNSERDQFLHQIIELLEVDKNLVIMGHSRGSVDADSGNSVIGLVPINFVGLTPHHSIRPLWALQMLAKLCGWSLTRRILYPMIYQYYTNVLMFRTTAEIAATCLQTMGCIDFVDQNRYIKALSESDVRILAIHSGKDPLVEKEISTKFIKALGNTIELACNTLDGSVDEKMVEQITNAFRNGNKHLSAFFAKDGHYLQKFRADFLAQSIAALVSHCESTGGPSSINSS